MVDRAQPRRSGAAPSTLDVWVFDSADAADAASKILRRRSALAADTSAIVINWPAGQDAPELDEVRRDEAAGTWGSALFDAVFLEPLQRAIEGRPVEDVDGEAPLGLERMAVNRLRDEVVPISSALVVAGGDVDRIDQDLGAHRPVTHWSTSVDLPAAATGS